MAFNQCNTIGDVDESKGTSELTGEEIWFVAAYDAVRSMSLDELDEAFALGVLDASTLVWTEGMESWAPLGTVAGLGSESAPSAEAAPDPEEEEDTQRMPGASGTRWLLTATAVLGITGTLGMSFALQTRDRSLVESARFKEPIRSTPSYLEDAQRTRISAASLMKVPMTGR